MQYTFPGFVQRPGLLKALLLSAALLALSGCASQLAGSKPEDVVAKRVDQRWSALIAGKFDAAYALTSPTYRATNDLAKYRANFAGAVAWKEVELVTVQCAEDRCTARMRVTVNPPAGLAHVGQITTGVEEVWVRQQDAWWHDPR